MLCNAFDYKLDSEHMIDESQSAVTVSSKSKADYICWVLCTHKPQTEVEVCVVVLETKHKAKINNAITKTLGYYIKSRAEQDGDLPGLAILLNEDDGKVQIRVFLFPYNTGVKRAMQALMLPELMFNGSLQFVKANLLNWYIFCV